MNSIFLLGGAALLSASTVLLFLLCRQARYLRSMDRTLSAILEGNRNLRVRFPGSLKGLGGVETRINGLAELLQRAEDQGRELEAGRRRFMTNISHDLRTPLTALLGYAELLEGLADGEVESRERYRRKIREKGEQLSSLMERFFSLSLMESGEYPLHPESLDLWEQLRRSLLEFALPLGELGIEPEVHLPPEPLMIRADGAALGRILENLFSNVCRYTPRGGSLKVEGFRRDSRGWCGSPTAVRRFPGSSCRSFSNGSIPPRPPGGRAMVWASPSFALWSNPWGGKWVPTAAPGGSPSPSSFPLRKKRVRVSSHSFHPRRVG